MTRRLIVMNEMGIGTAAGRDAARKRAATGEP